jgi:ABC-type branched-subunit amino acid transport system substrate-binding protein
MIFQVKGDHCLLRLFLTPFLTLLFLIVADNRAFCVDKGIKVGVIAGFTGDYAAYGSAFKNGIELANVDPNIKFIFEDDQFIPSKTLSAFHKLTSVEKVNIILVGDSTSGQAIAPIAKKLKIPLLVWATSQNIFKGNKYVIRLWSDPDKDFNSIKNLIHKKGWQKIAIFTASHFYSEQWGLEISRSFNRVSWERFATDPESFQTQLLKAKNYEIDALGVCLDPGTNGRLIKQARELKLTVPIFGCNFLESRADALTAKSNINGVLFTSPNISGSFFNAYKKKFATTDHILSAAIFHDAAGLINSAFLDTRPKILIDKIHQSSLTTPAIVGFKITNGSSETFLDFEFATYVYSDGQIKQVENSIKLPQ